MPDDPSAHGTAHDHAHDHGCHHGAPGHDHHHLSEPRLDALDDIERIGPEALQDDPARDFTLAIQLGKAAPFVGAELDPRNVSHPQGRAVLSFQDNVLDVGDALQVAAPAHHELEFGELDGPSTYVRVAGPDGLAQSRQGDALRAEAARVDDDVVLLDEAAHGGNFGDTLRP